MIPLKNLGIKAVFYRGQINSCNYNCPYCPFHMNGCDLAADEAALNKFCGKVSELGEKLTVMFVPRGEALIHKYYHNAIAALCKYDNIATVGSQTNLSFDIKEFAATVAAHKSKISLWCSFHPSQTGVNDFLGQCEMLYEYGIGFCAGAVGCPSDIPVLQQLRQSLPEDVYMWINALDGLPREYTDEEITALTKIDPLFRLENMSFIADPKLCSGGKENVFIDSSGDYFACNISKVRIGNLYSGKKYERVKICRSKRCSCYLAYLNRTEMQDIFLSPDTVATRHPSTKKVIFFDIDGTLPDNTGIIPKKNVAAIKELSRISLIFFTTSLPFNHAKQTYRDIWEYAAGGVFAEGSDIRIFDRGFKKIIPHKDADKLVGMRCICRELRVLADNVTIVGNSAKKLQGL